MNPRRFPIFLRRCWTSLLDVLFPPLCLKCEGPVAQDQALCAACWKTVRFISSPLCARCGQPFDFVVEEGTLCAPCLSTPSLLEKTRSAVVYDESSKAIILRFKHGDRLHPARALANWMLRAGADVLDGADVIAPVPLHRWRLLRRKYNQSALLAQALAALSGVPLAPDLLLRVRPTDSQGHRNRKERAQNVKDAFALNESYDITGKTVLLIDDVRTSGATLESCAQILLASGAGKVRALTLARVLFKD